MKRNHNHGSTLVILTVLLVAGLPVLADGDARSVSARGPVDLAAVKVFPGVIDLAPNVRYERAILTVSGVGRTYTLEFDSGTRPSISPFDAAGEMLPDGVYRWQLSLVPDAITARGLRESANANNGVPQRPWLPKSGSFAVRGGSFAPSEVREAGARDDVAERSARAGRRADVPAQQFGGQMLGGEKNLAGRAAAVDLDETAGQHPDEGLLKAGAAAAHRAGGDRSGERSTQTGPDSDRQAAEIGASAEPVLIAIPKAHEMNVPDPRPRSDGANGRPRSDR